VTAGLLLLPGMLPLPLLGGPAGRLTDRLGPWPTCALGLGVGAAGFAGLAATVGRLHGPADHALLLCALLVWGCGLGVLTPAVVAAALLVLPDAQGTASGASNTARQTGGALGVAVFAAVAGAASGPSFTARAVVLLAAAAGVFAAAAVHCARRDRSHRGAAGEQ
jgi:DHA2 family methylenomycin A resistance protein-like MFS transporter